jgi:hypothetical protein
VENVRVVDSSAVPMVSTANCLATVYAFNVCGEGSGGCEGRVVSVKGESGEGVVGSNDLGGRST